MDIILLIFLIGIVLIGVVFILKGCKKTPDFNSKTNKNVIEGVIESVEVKSTGYCCCIRRLDNNELIKIDNMDVSLITEYTPGYGTSKDYDEIIGKKIKLIKNQDGTYDYDLFYKKRNEILLWTIVIMIAIIPLIWVIWR